MRTIDTLARQYPNLTGAELIQLQEQDKLDDRKEWEEQHAELKKLAEDFNANGAFFRGAFGTEQRYYYQVTNAHLDEAGTLRGDVTQILSFSHSIEIIQKDWQDLSKYGLDYCTRVAEEEYQRVLKVFEDFRNLWPEATEQDSFRDSFNR